MEHPGSFQPQCEVPLDHQEIVIDYLRNSPSFCIQKATTLMENLGSLLIPTASRQVGFQFLVAMGEFIRIFRSDSGSFLSLPFKPINSGPNFHRFLLINATTVEMGAVLQTSCNKWDFYCWWKSLGNNQQIHGDPLTPGICMVMANPGDHSGKWGRTSHLRAHLYCHLQPSNCSWTNVGKYFVKCQTNEPDVDQSRLGKLALLCYVLYSSQDLQMKYFDISLNLSPQRGARTHTHG